MGDMIKLGGLWENESKDGKKYFSGSLGGAKILIFPNKFKEQDNQPDYQMYVAEKQKQESAGTTVQQDNSMSPQMQKAMQGVSPSSQDPMPF